MQTLPSDGWQAGHTVDVWVYGPPSHHLEFEVTTSGGEILTQSDPGDSVFDSTGTWFSTLIPWTGVHDYLHVRARDDTGAYVSLLISCC